MQLKKLALTVVGAILKSQGCAEHEGTLATHPCEWAHEGETCTYSAFKFFPGAYLRALPVYLPVYVLPAILVHRCAATWSSPVRASSASAHSLHSPALPPAATRDWCLSLGKQP